MPTPLLVSPCEGEEVGLLLKLLPPPRPSRRLRQASQTGPLPTNALLGAEFRQIGLITTLIVTILIVLTFVLG